MPDQTSFSLGANSGIFSPNLQVVGLAAPIRHAFQALTALAVDPARCQDAGKVAGRCRLPEAALSKTFQTLARRGLLESRRGPGGGYRLALAPEKISLSAVAEALGAGRERRGRCLLAERACRGDEPCLLHGAAVEADRRLGRELAVLTLADLAADSRKRSGAG